MPYKTKNSKQKGGKVLGKGSFGCVVDPPVMCSKTDSKNKVSKIIKLDGLKPMEIEDLKEEFKISKMFMKKDPNNKYFLGGIEQCKISSNKINKKDKKKCGINKKKEVPLMSIIMKKAEDFEKVAPKLNNKNLLKSIAHLLNGAKIAVYDLKILLLDIKYLNLLYAKDVKATEKLNKKRTSVIHPVFIDFSPDLMAKSKREFKIFLKSMGDYYAVWPLEILLTIYMNLKNTPIRLRNNWKEYFNSKKEAIEVTKSNMEMTLKNYEASVKAYNGFKIKGNQKIVDKIVANFKDEINHNYKEISDKIMVYQIANSFNHIAARNKKIFKVIEPMLYPDFNKRLSIKQSLARIKKHIGSVAEKDLLITYKKKTVFGKFYDFMTKPVNVGQRGAGPIKPPGQSWEDYWAEEEAKEMKRRYKEMFGVIDKKPKRKSRKKIKKKKEIQKKK